MSPSHPSTDSASCALPPNLQARCLSRSSWACFWPGSSSRSGAETPPAEPTLWEVFQGDQGLGPSLTGQALISPGAQIAGGGPEGRLHRGMIWASLASRGILDQRDHQGPRGPLGNR